MFLIHNSCSVVNNVELIPGLIDSKLTKFTISLGSW